MDDFSPTKLVGHTYQGASHKYSIILDPFGPLYSKTAPSFAAHNIEEPGGYAWAAVAKALIALHNPELGSLVGYDPEGSMFAAYGNDYGALLGLAGLLREAVHNPLVLQQAIAYALEHGYDMD